MNRIKKMLRHRGISHSLFLFGLMLLLVWVTRYIPTACLTAAFVTCVWLEHVFGDMSSNQGACKFVIKDQGSTFYQARVGRAGDNQ